MRVLLASLMLTAVLPSVGLAEVIGTARGCALYEVGGESAVLSDATVGDEAITQIDDALLIKGDILFGYEFTCDLARSPIFCEDLGGDPLKGSYERRDLPDGTRMLFNGEVFGVFKPCR
jgi:hypothetical protein